MASVLFAPYIIYGNITDRSGTAVVNALVTALNTATGDEITTIATPSGQYAFDCANFERGYYDGQVIKLSAFSANGAVYDLFFSVDGGNTWQQVENNKTTNLIPNAFRHKLNLILNPGGITNLNIKLIA